MADGSDCSLATMIDGSDTQEVQTAPPQYLIVKVVTDKSYADYEGFDLANFENPRWPKTTLSTFRTPKEEYFGAFKRQFCGQLEFSPDHVRCWVLVKRQNQTIRPFMLIPEDEQHLKLEHIVTSLGGKNENELRLYAETIDPHKLPKPSDFMLIFLKYFDPLEQALRGHGSIYLSRNDKPSDLALRIIEQKSWEPGTVLDMFEEIKPGMIGRLEYDSTIAQLQLWDGDIIAFERRCSDREVQSLESRGRHASLENYYAFLFNLVLCRFVKSDKTSSFELELYKKDNYDKMILMVAQHLRVPTARLRLFSTTTPVNDYLTNLARNKSVTIGDIPLTEGLPKPVIFYELLDNRPFRLGLNREVIWMGHNNKRQNIYRFTTRVQDKFKDLHREVGKVAAVLPGGTGQIRLFQISPDGKSQKALDMEQLVSSVPEPTKIYAEELLREELDAEACVINIFHFTKDFSTARGVPFKFVALLGEQIKDTRKRLQKRLVISEEVIATYRLALQVANFKHPLFLDDDEMIYHAGFTPEYLGLNYVQDFSILRSRLDG